MVFDPTMGGDETQPQGDQPTAAPMPEEQKEEGAAPAAGDQPAA